MSYSRVFLSKVFQCGDEVFFCVCVGGCCTLNTNTKDKDGKLWEASSPITRAVLELLLSYRKLVLLLEQC